MPTEVYSSDGNYIDPKAEKDDKARRGYRRIVTIKKEPKDKKDPDDEEQRRKRMREKLTSKGADSKKESPERNARDGDAHTAERTGQKKPAVPGEKEVLVNLRRR